MMASGGKILDGVAVGSLFSFFCVAIETICFFVENLKSHNDLRSQIIPTHKRNPRGCFSSSHGINYRCGLNSILIPGVKWVGKKRWGWRGYVN